MTILTQRGSFGLVLLTTLALAPIGFLPLTKIATLVTHEPPGHSYVIGGVSDHAPERSRRHGLQHVTHSNFLSGLILSKTSF